MLLAMCNDTRKRSYANNINCTYFQVSERIQIYLQIQSLLAPPVIPAQNGLKIHSMHPPTIIKYRIIKIPYITGERRVTEPNFNSDFIVLTIYFQYYIKIKASSCNGLKDNKFNRNSGYEPF